MASIPVSKSKLNYRTLRQLISRNIGKFMKKSSYFKQPKSVKEYVTEV